MTCRNMVKVSVLCEGLEYSISEWLKICVQVNGNRRIDNVVGQKGMRDSR